MEVLDRIDSPKNKKRSKVFWLPIILLWTLVLLYLIPVFVLESWGHIYSIIALALVTGLTYLRKNIGLLFTAVALVIWSFDGLPFPSGISLYLTFSTGEFVTRIDLVVLSILILHYALYAFRNIDLFGKEGSIDLEQSELASVMKFKHRLSKKSTMELENILEEGRLVPDALKAAEQILKERK